MTTLRPLFFSSSRRALPATVPPSWAACLFSGKPWASRVAGDFGRGGLAEHGEDEFEVSHVVAQILALEPLELGVLAGVRPKVALEISAVRMAYSRCSRTPRFFHSSVSSSRMAMERIRFSIQSSE